MKTRVLIEYLLAVILVLILGSLAGWYFFLRTQTKTTVEQGTARGFGIAIPEGRANGDIPAGLARTDGAASTGQAAQRPAQLWQVEEKPTAGHAFIGSGDSLRLRYVERAGGYVFDANTGTGLRTRLTNTLLPKIYEAQLSENGHVFERSIDTLGNITTFAGTVSTSTDSSSASPPAMTLLGSYLAKNIVNLSTHPVSGALLYTIADTSGGAVVSAEWDGQKPKTLLGSAILSWRPAVLDDGRAFLVQAAADGIPGYGYELKKDGTLSRLLGPVPGLVMRVRPSLKGEAGALLWSQSTRGELRLFVRVGQNATAVQIPVRTTADKCAWLPGKDLIAYCGVPQGSIGQDFLDNWYRGSAHSSDSLWRIDASAGTVELVFTPPSNTPVDIENIMIDRAGSALAFTNAADKSLWLYRLLK
ncbi:MAG: hypothetical protein Q7R90_03940 [bacterium]|nr:hypothetical protein [bacterium]